MQVGVLGATGPAGSALAARLASVGVEVIVGSRHLDKAAGVVAELTKRWDGLGAELVPGTNRDAAQAELVIVATPWEGAVATVLELAPELSGKIVVSMVNAMVRWGDRFVPLLPPTGSVAVAIAKSLPASQVAGAFHHLPAGPSGGPLPHVGRRRHGFLGRPRCHRRGDPARRPDPWLARRRRRRPGLRAGSRGPHACSGRSQPALQDSRFAAGNWHRLTPQQMRLYDTARQEVASFEPGAGRGGTVTIYTCGITPYDAAHLGHAATYLAYDVLQRRLRDLGYKTRLVRNVTDVDDDMLRKARQIGVYYLDLAAEEMAIFSADMEALGLLPAASEPRATSAIPDILGFIGMVLANGHAYQAGGAVYFDVSSWPEFGAVSHYVA